MSRTIVYVIFCLCGVAAMGQEEYVFPETVKPLIQTYWGQGTPFNLLCPKNEKGGDLDHNLAGCGAVAMAQVINYHQYPGVSPDGKYFYDWWKMYRTFNGQQTTDELISVAKLISDCGVSSFTKYSENASGTSISAMMGALKRLFFYGDQIGIYSRDSMVTLGLDTLYKRLLFEELKAGRPVLYRGYDEKKKDGHLFIIDGCKGSKVHVNMGWGGNKNAFYDLDDLNGYTKGQWMLTEVADTSFRPLVKEAVLTEAGTLGQCLSKDERRMTRHLKVRGPVDGRDFGVLRQMLRCGVLRTIDMSDAEIEYLPDSAFCGCGFLSYYVMPRTVRRIGNRAFQSCTNLNHVVFFEGVQRIGGSAFYNCSNLLSLRLPTTVRTIQDNAFNSCMALLNVTLPDGLETVESWAFSHCRHLNSLALPASVRYVGKGILNDCPRLKRVDIDTKNSTYYVEGVEIKKK